MVEAPPDLSGIGGRLRYAREAAGLSSRQLSQRAGIAQAIAGMIERGATRAPTTETVQRIASVLGVSLDWLIAGTGQAPSPEDIRRFVSSSSDPAA